MKKSLRSMHIVFVAAIALAGVFLSGCGRPVGGPRFWYDDRSQSRLDDYSLPDDPGAPAEDGMERRAMASGEDISEEDLDNYHTDLDKREEDRKADASLLDF